MLTRVICALVYVNLTGGAFITRMAGAGEAIHRRRCIDAGSVVLARVLGAIVNVDFTVGTFVPIWTVAPILGDQIFTGGAILTRGLLAFIDLLFAPRAVVTWLAGARIAIDLIQASSFV